MGGVAGGGGGGGGKSAGGGGGDGNAVGGGDSTGLDPTGLGDPLGLGGGDMGFAGGGGDVSGGGRGPDTSAASVANTQLQAPYDIQAGGGLRSSGGGPATDQPQPQRYTSASAALMGGPNGAVHDFSSQGGTPDSPRVMEPWAPSPNTNLAQPDSFNERFNATTPDASFNERFNAAQPDEATRGITVPQGSSGGGVNMPIRTPYSDPNTGSVNMPIRTPYQDLNTGSVNMPVPPPPDVNVPIPQSRPQPPVANVPIPQERPSLGMNLPSSTATPPAASPAEAATGQGMPGPSTGSGGGGQPQSPLEQLIGQFLGMLGIGGQGGGMGGILSPMEHMLARALGINLPQPYPGFNPGFHSPFFQPPGPGQFPAGTTGGRPPLSQFQPPGSPRPWPGTPGAPGTTSGTYNPSSYTRALINIESGGNPNQRTGSNIGLGQFSRDQWAHYGITAANYRNPQVQARAIQQEANENTPKLRNILGRNPTSAELYLAHQQGVAGASALLKNPNMPAWQAIRRFYGSDAIAQRAIHGNIPSGNQLRAIPVQNVTAGQFVNMWTNRFNRAMQ